MERNGKLDVNSEIEALKNELQALRQRQQALEDMGSSHVAGVTSYSAMGTSCTASASSSFTN